ncbi:2-oxo-3-hexenedioate decarboxylase [Acidovorax soli]|uniref:2-oxo-3-hexenedioate decarboxylase n=1 Tax=Acidovorax soli TaxID=592050 RepID=A0A7X0PJH6_9BURK|nr:hydratase [Acidovorax soli]MBB6563097.1 2-oxo-3-hexenedioate decarboxylase [Acidovorax soli]
MEPRTLLAHYDNGTLWPAQAAAGIGGDVAVAYQQALAVRSLRQARGEEPRGYKIGFTNRNIWAHYQVFGPIWGTVWSTTLRFCAGEGRVSLDHCAQPRLEPEAVFGLKATPAPDASLDDLFDAIDWVAPGFEIVQSHQPGWKFTAAQTVADSALHCDGEAREQGQGANVLGGPLNALHHFLKELRACPGAPDLQPGDVVTTGTWTDAWPVQPGQRWSADFDAPLSRLSVTFT